MWMKKGWLLLLFFPLGLSAQEYVDVLKFNYGSTFKNKFENTSNSTKIRAMEAEFTFPIPVTKSQAIITGIDHSNDRLQLFPQDDFTTLYNTTLKLGVASVWNEKWSSSVVLLPKISSDYRHLSNEDFYMGIYATFAIQKQENLKLRFGFYGSSEAYGIFATPIIGWHYLSTDKRFEMNMSLPISGIMTYYFDRISVRIDYFGISRSFRVHKTEVPTLYADLTSIRFSGFVQKEIFNSILFRAKTGYSTNSYKMFETGEKIDFALSTINFGDHRTQLNPKIGGSFFFKVEAIYRFKLSEE